MSVSDTVRRLARQFNEEPLAQSATEWSNASMSSCKDIISTVKKIIKDKKEVPAAKLMALKVRDRQLLHQCMLKANGNFIQFASKKVMRRFTIFAAYKKETSDMNRGVDIFGAISLASDQCRAASAEFLRCLLNYIRIWSQRYGKMSDGSPSVYLKSYTSLVNSGVTFPPAEEQAGGGVSVRRPSGQQAGGSQALSKQEIEACSNAAQLLLELLNSSSPDAEMLVQLSTSLRAFLVRLERDLNLKTGQPGFEDHISQLIELNDFVQQALNKHGEYQQRARPVGSGVPISEDLVHVNFDDEEEDFRKAMAASLRPNVGNGGRPIVEDVSPALAQQRDSKQAEEVRQDKENMLRKLQEELAAVKKEAADFAQASEYRKGVCAQIKASTEAQLAALMDKQKQEIQAKEALLSSQTDQVAARNKLTELQKVLEQLQSKLRDKENDHMTIRKALDNAQRENQRLKSALLDAEAQPQVSRVPAPMKRPDPSQSVYASQDFQTLRVSVASEQIPPLVLKPELSVYAQRQPDNAQFLRTALQTEKGVLYTDPEIEIGFMFKMAQGLSLLMYIGNKHDSGIDQLHSFMLDYPSEGLVLAINKEIEEQPITRGNKVNRVVSIQAKAVFASLPRIILTFQ